MCRRYSFVFEKPDGVNPFLNGVKKKENEESKEGRELKFCDNGHPPIEYDNHYCPMCDLQVEYAKLTLQVRRSKKPRQNRSKDDKEKIKDLQKRNAELREKLLDIKGMLRGRI